MYYNISIYIYEWLIHNRLLLDVISGVVLRYCWFVIKYPFFIFVSSDFHLFVCVVLVLILQHF